jgi:hypothetical protein
VVPTWRALDGLAADAWAAPVFSDERPLRGVAGLLDWRLSGRLSAWLRAGQLVGAPGERLVFPPPGGKVNTRAVVLFGLGRSRDFDEANYREALRATRRALVALGGERFALALPQLRGEVIDRGRLWQLTVEALRRDRLTGELVLVAPSPSPSRQTNQQEQR